MKRRRFGPASRLFGAQITISVANLPVTILLARTLGPEGLGEYQYLNRTTLLAIGLCVFGFPHALAWAAAAAVSQQDRRILTIKMYLVSAVGALVLALGMWLGSKLGLLEPTTALALFTVYAALNVVSASQMNLLRGWLAIRQVLVSRLTQALIWSVSVSVLFVTNHLTILTAISALLAGQLVSLIIGFLVIRSYVGRTDLYDQHESKTISWAALTKFAGRAFPSIALREWALHLDQIVVGYLLGVAALGTYTVGASLSIALGLATTPLTNTIQPVLQRAKGLEEQRASVVRFYALTLIAFSVPGVVAVLSAPVFLPAVYGDEFAGAVSLFQILTVAALFSAMSACGHGCLLALGKPGTSSVCLALGFAVSILLWILLIQRFELIGMAFASMLGTATAAIAMSWRVAKVLRWGVAAFPRAVVSALARTVAGPCRMRLRSQAQSEGNKVSRV